jgi:hypothetical protein
MWRVRRHRYEPAVSIDVSLERDLSRRWVNGEVQPSRSVKNLFPQLLGIRGEKLFTELGGQVASVPRFGKGQPFVDGFVAEVPDVLAPPVQQKPRLEEPGSSHVHEIGLRLKGAGLRPLGLRFLPFHVRRGR